MIHYITGDATQPIGEGHKIICHVCNDIGAWGAGFVMALSARWDTPEAAYRRWHRAQPLHRLPLGDVQFVNVEDDIDVVNMVAQTGTRASAGIPPIRYEALAECLRAVATGAAGQCTIHMPRIGCGLAGGNWAEVEKLIEHELSDYEVYVYDLPVPADTCA